tara:strand:- start:462 stop:950 length:489 start_codon:yes stop_codon:yes gene_type:complete
MRNKYPAAFKERCLARLEGPEGVSVKDLVKETGVSQFTLYDWVRKSREAPFMARSSSYNKGKKWSLDEQVRILAAARELSDAELGPYLRKEGVHPDLLEAWQNALQGSRVDPTSQKQIRSLERNLRRKEKALAEAAALLLLQKKAQAIWGGGEGDTPEESES